MYNFYLVADSREELSKGLNCEEKYSDHPSTENISSLLEAIKKTGHHCTYYGGVRRLIADSDKQIKYPKNVIFLNFSDGLSQSYSRVQVPMLCELLEAPYSGSGVFASALINNKFCTNLTLKEFGIDVPRALRATKYHTPSFSSIEAMLPVFIKPNAEGSSMGITGESYQSNINGAFLHIDSLLKEFDEILIEEYVPGIDITVFLIGNKTIFSCIESLNVSAHEESYLTKDAKSNRKITRVPACKVISKETNDLVCNLSVKIFQQLQCRDFARFDFRITEGGGIFFIEANTCPRISQTSEIGHIAKNNKKTFEDYLGYIVETVIDRVEQGALDQS